MMTLFEASGWLEFGSIAIAAVVMLFFRPLSRYVLLRRLAIAFCLLLGLVNGTHFSCNTVAEYASCRGDNADSVEAFSMEDYDKIDNLRRQEVDAFFAEHIVATEPEHWDLPVSLGQVIKKELFSTGYVLHLSSHPLVAERLRLEAKIDSYSWGSSLSLPYYWFWRLNYHTACLALLLFSAAAALLRAKPVTPSGPAATADTLRQ